MKKQRERIDNLIGRSDFGLLLITIGLFLIFAFFTDAFLSSYNMFNLFRTSGTYIFIALAQAMCIVVGGVSLAIGAVGGFCGVIFGIALENLGWPIFPAVVVTLIASMLIGAMNGMLITKLKLTAFVVSLAMQFFFIGLNKGITKGFPFVNLPSNITWLGRNGIAGVIPYLMILGILALMTMAYFFRYTVTGRHILATGDNLEAARLSGINTSRVIIICHILSGIFSACATFMYTTRLGSIQPTLGEDWMMTSFAVAMIGGTSQKGGQFSPVGLFSAAIMITLIRNGLTIAKVNMYFEQAFIGLIILGAVILDSWRNNSSIRRLLLQTMQNDEHNN